MNEVERDVLVEAFDAEVARLKERSEWEVALSEARKARAETAEADVARLNTEMAVSDAQVESLTDEVERLNLEVGTALVDAALYLSRAEKAEAALERVRALHPVEKYAPWPGEGMVTDPNDPVAVGCATCASYGSCATVRAIDGPPAAVRTATEAAFERVLVDHKRALGALAEDDGPMTAVSDDPTPEDRCSQCGKGISDRACGPTHALLYADQKAAAVPHEGGEMPTRCHAQRDGECRQPCPQLRDGEPTATGRHCPVDLWDVDGNWPEDGAR